VLPTAFCRDPVTGGDVNLSGTLRLLRLAVQTAVARFVFASSASVYGNSGTQICTESTRPSPDDPYGAAKLAIEEILAQIASVCSMETVSLRIARVLGLGAKNTRSAWRSQMFESPSSSGLLAIPFAPGARLSVIHVEDLARALEVLVESPRLPRPVYNAPAEIITADEIKRLAEAQGWQVSLGDSLAGPEIDGTRFSRDFAPITRPLKDHMQRVAAGLP
jgi:nucleoside-diphosphate-sugar epimerase